MPVGADTEGTRHLPPARSPGGRAGALVFSLVLSAALVLSIPACTADRAPSDDAAGGAASAGTSGGTAVANTASDTAAAMPPADVAAIRVAIGAINSTAGGPVPVQRAELQKLVAPDQLARQRECPTARSTLAFQPAYHDLRLAPSSTSGSATAYLLPTYITIYTGDRITGTDLTTLHLWVADGTARTAALCVS